MHTASKVGDIEKEDLPLFQNQTVRIKKDSDDSDKKKIQVASTILIWKS